MTLIVGWVFSLLLHPPHEAEITERLKDDAHRMVPGQLLGS